MDVLSKPAVDISYTRTVNSAEQAGKSAQSNVNSNIPVSQDSSAAGKDKELSAKDIEDLASGLNQFFVNSNLDLKFQVHNKTNQLIVQFVDTKDMVIKEFPQHEFLDVVAKIREYIGAILDKKA